MMEGNTYVDLLRAIQHWNEYRVPILRISQPDNNLLFKGAMRFYFQDAGQKVATKCVIVNSSDTTKDVINVLIEKFRPDMRMLSVPEYGLYEIHENGDERKLDPDERPLLVQLEWNQDDLEGRFLLRRMDEKTRELNSHIEEPSLKRKLSKKEKKKQDKIKKGQDKFGENNKNGNNNNNSNGNNNNSSNNILNGNNSTTTIANTLYNELPETSFTRSISNPEAVMKRQRAQKLEKRLQEAGGTLRIFGETINKDVSYKTLLLSTRDNALSVVKQCLEKYGKKDENPCNYCLVQLVVPQSTSANSLREIILEDHDRPLLIYQNHDMSKGYLTFHIKRKPADYQRRNNQVQQNQIQPNHIQQHQQQQHNHIHQNHQIPQNHQIQQNHIQQNHNLQHNHLYQQQQNHLQQQQNHLQHNQLQQNHMPQFNNQSADQADLGVFPPQEQVSPNFLPLSYAPQIMTIQLRKINNSMGLSIIAAMGFGQDRLGIYVKNVIKNGPAALDGRLQAGDQLLEVNGFSLIGITQDSAAGLMNSIGPIVILRIAKQAAVYHNLTDIINGATIEPPNNIAFQETHQPFVTVPQPFVAARQPFVRVPPPNVRVPPPFVAVTQPYVAVPPPFVSVPSPPIGSPQKSPKKVSWVDIHSDRSLHTLIQLPPPPHIMDSQNDEGDDDDDEDQERGIEDRIPDEPEQRLHQEQQEVEEEDEEMKDDKGLTMEDINEVLMSGDGHKNWIEDTAGVIGTQEVYNDPRQRIVRAREQTTAEENNNIEQLSFKEKLEMFKKSN